MLRIFISWRSLNGSDVPKSESTSSLYRSFHAAPTAEMSYIDSGAAGLVIGSVGSDLAVCSSLEIITS